jgi:DNA-directed RNA polymerase subunit RPC12/RpoP
METKKQYKCWECQKTLESGDTWFYFYHGDQDDRVCPDCAKKLKHTDTCYAGQNVFESDIKEVIK